MVHLAPELLTNIAECLAAGKLCTRCSHQQQLHVCGERQQCRQSWRCPEELLSSAIPGLAQHREALAAHATRTVSEEGLPSHISSTGYLISITLLQTGQLAAGATHIAHNVDACERCAFAAARHAGNPEFHQGGHLGHSALCERSDAGTGPTSAAAAAAQSLGESKFEVGSGKSPSSKENRREKSEKKKTEISHSVQFVCSRVVVASIIS